MTHSRPETVANAWTFSEVATLVGLTALLPFLLHLIPSWDDSPIGGKLIPLFYAPLVAAMHGRVRVSLCLSLAMPWVNHLLFGMPPLERAVLLCVEVVTFTGVVAFLAHKGQRAAWVGPLAFLACKPCAALVILILPSVYAPMAPMGYMQATILNAWPGMLLLAGLSYLAGRTPSH